jgi:hypothetical protein
MRGIMAWNKEEQAQIATISEGVRSMREIELPEIKVDVREARDTARTTAINLVHLTSRVETIEKSPIPEHGCIQVEDITEIQSALKSILTSRKVWFPVAVTVVLMILGFLGNSIRTTETMSNNIFNNTNSIKAINESQKVRNKQFEYMIKAVDAIPDQIESSVQPYRNSDKIIENEYNRRMNKLSSTERRKMEKLWRKTD